MSSFYVQIIIIRKWAGSALRVILLFESCLWQDLASMIMRSKYGVVATPAGVALHCNATLLTQT